MNCRFRFWFRYSAALRLAQSTQRQRSDLVEQVILQLGLKDAADTLIGDNLRRGCSGGEKRRTSIGVQLLANPSVLFLGICGCCVANSRWTYDRHLNCVLFVIVGLDAFSALQVIQTLKSLATAGRTIIITIHQPRSDMYTHILLNWHRFFLFDSITLLSGGQTVYTGPVSEVLTYFDQNAFPCPPHVNPADYLIDISTIDTRTPAAEEESSRRVNSLILSWKRSQLVSSARHPSAPTVPPEAPIRAPGVSLSRQIWYLTGRNFWITIRDPFGLWGFLFLIPIR